MKIVVNGKNNLPLVRGKSLVYSYVQQLKALSLW